VQVLEIFAHGELGGDRSALAGGGCLLGPTAFCGGGGRYRRVVPHQTARRLHKLQCFQTRPIRGVCSSITYPRSQRGGSKLWQNCHHGASSLFYLSDFLRSSITVPFCNGAKNLCIRLPPPTKTTSTPIAKGILKKAGRISNY